MLSLKTETDVLRETAAAVRQQRLVANISQAELARRSGLPLGTLRRLEQTGQGGFLALAKVLTTLGMVDHFLGALKRPAETTPSLNAFLADKAAQVGRRRSRRVIPRNAHPGA